MTGLATPHTSAPPPGAALPRFARSFTEPLPIPEEGLRAAEAVMRSGRLHRYDAAPGEEAEAAALEREFAAWQGRRYALALASGGQALQVALRAVGVGPGEPVLLNAWTLAPVPGAVAALGARAVLVEVTEDLVIDLHDLAAKARASGARVLLLSLMRGHLPDMARLMALADGLGLVVVEDCAHTMGAAWADRRSGSWGAVACFSTQTYKHLNSGEGGLLATDDDGIAARATLLSGAYMHHARHGAGPPAAALDAAWAVTPNLSARMDNLRAALLRPQLRGLDAACAAWTERHDRIARALARHPRVRLPRRPPEERYVGSSLQFRLPGIGADAARALVAEAARRGVEIRWSGAPEPQGYTSTHAHWGHVAPQALPRTDAVLAGLFDMRLPLAFGPEDCDLVAAHLAAAADAAAAAPAASAPPAPATARARAGAPARA